MNNSVWIQTVLGVAVCLCGFHASAGEHIVFCSQRTGITQIFAMNPDGTGQTNLTQNQQDSYDPCLSRDGTRITYELGGINGDIMIMNADGSGQTNLTQSVAFDCDPYFSPDGRKIVFTSDRDGDFEIYLMNSDGTGQTNLTRSPTTGDRVPAFAPDGQNIVYASDYNIWLMNIDGTNKRQLTTTGMEYYPSFSPDGHYILFSSYRDGNWEIYRMNADGTGQTNLTQNPAQDTFPVSVSPDCRKIAFTSDRDGNYEIYTMDFGGGSPNRLTFNAAMDRQPSWGPQLGPTAVFIWTAVEIGWPSVANRNYQVQWTTNLESAMWSNLCDIVTGDGTTDSVFDTTRNSGKKFYRVLEAQ
jgi:Tol biopolymer transport system component